MVYTMVIFIYFEYSSCDNRNGFTNLFFKENIFGVRAGIQYTPSCDDHILAWDFTF